MFNTSVYGSEQEMAKINSTDNYKMAAKPDPSSSDRANILNFNIGVLGHIDSGKTSLGIIYYILYVLICAVFL